MLIKVKTLKGYKLNGIDGEIGSVDEIFFDDKYWTVRYLVVDAGSWFTNRRVLISPYFIQSINTEAELVKVNLTKQQIYDSPEWESDKPVSRQYEESYTSYYGTPNYWGGTMMWGTYDVLVRDSEKWNVNDSEKDSWDPNLRSTKDVSGHDFEAIDGEIGHVDDFIVDDDSWTIRYFVLETNSWFSSRKTLISTQWIDRISWDEEKVYINTSREIINHVPEYDEDMVLTREYETQLHTYYNREGYWYKDQNASTYSHL